MEIESRPLDHFLPTVASARAGRAVAGLLVALGLLAAAKPLWNVGTDLYARQSWPQARGELVSISEASSSGSGRASRRTRYWVEFVVHFAVPPSECKTGVTGGGDGRLAVCVGTVRTRSTQSATTAGNWMREAFHDRSVSVRYEPDGPDIKIAGEPLSLRYPWDAMLAIAVWIFLFGTALSVARRRVRALERREAQGQVDITSTIP
jgi:hypothetical protein